MSLIFNPLSLDLVEKMYRNSELDYLGKQTFAEFGKALHTRVDKARRLYWGGERAIEILEKMEAERPEKFAFRARLIKNLRIVRIIVDHYIAVTYGEEPTRVVWVGDRPMAKAELARMLVKRLRGEDVEIPKQSNDSDFLDVAVQQVYTDNQSGIMFQRGIREYLCAGLAPCKTWLQQDMPGEDGEITGIRSDFVPLGKQAWPILNPDDKQQAIATVEHVGEGKVRLWGDREWGLYSDTGKWLGIREEIPEEIGNVWNFLGDFDAVTSDVAFVADAVLAQRVAVNLQSALNIVRIAQGFSIPVLEGDLDEEATQQTEEGERSAKVSPMDFLKLRTGSNFAFANPDAPIGELQAALIQDVKMDLQHYGLPSDYTSEQAGTERPMAKVLGWLATMFTRRGFVGFATEFEEGLARTVMGHMAAYRDDLNRLPRFEIPTFNPDDASFEVTFRQNPIPTDEKDRRETLRADVAGGLRHPIDAIIDLNPTWDAERVAREYLAIEEEQQRNDPLRNLNLTAAPLGEGEI